MVSNVIIGLYRIPGIFMACIIIVSRLSMKPGFLRIKVIQKFLRVCALLHGYVQRIYPTNLSKIDRAPYQIVYHSRGNPPRPPWLWQSWESVL